jgi:hypothetical protein
VSHHKCGTQWTLGVLRDVLDVAGLAHATVDWRDSVRGLDYRRFDAILVQDHDPAMAFDLARVARGLHVVRDPRDILISLYFSHRDSHPARDPLAWEILRDRVVLQQVPMTEGLRYLFDHSTYFARVMASMAAWDYHDGRFLELRFEEFVQQASPTRVQAALDFLGVSIGADAVARTLDRWDFGRLQATPRAADGATRHYRAGGRGEWREAFDDDLAHEFDRRHGDLLERLGYGATA